MVLAAFRFPDKAHFAFSCGRMSALSYEDILEDKQFIFAQAIVASFRMLQQDNSFIHTANGTGLWCLNNGVHVIKRPSVSPDSQQKMYEKNQLEQFIQMTQFRIKSCYQSHSEKIDQNALKFLVRSMPDLDFTLSKKFGACACY